jgi:hypothetical protein
MNPQSQGQPGQGENPFMKLLAQLQQGGGQQAPGQQQPDPQSALVQAQQAAQGGAQGAGGAGQPDVEDATIPGENPGVTKNLLGAMSQLHGAITTMTDPQEIQMLRNIIVMLNQLIVRDQETQNGKTGTMTGQQPGDSNFGGGDQGQPPTPPQAPPGQ